MIHTDAGVVFDQMTVYDWIEQLRARRPQVAHGPPARRRLQRGVRRRDERPGRAQPHVPARLPARARATSRSSASPTSGSTSPAATSSCRRRSPTTLGRQNVKLGWAMQSIAANADGTVSMTFSTPGKTQTVTADHVILSLPFAVLRTLDYSGANFDPLKKTAITQLGAGQNAKLQLQFATRYWNTQAVGLERQPLHRPRVPEHAGTSRAGRAAPPGSSSTTPAATSRAALTPSTPYSNAATNPQVTTYAKAFARRSSRRSSRASRSSGTGRRRCRRRSSIRLNSRTRTGSPGSTSASRGYEGVAQGNIHFAGEHCSQDFQGYMEGGAAEGARAADEVLAALKKS